MLDSRNARRFYVEANLTGSQGLALSAAIMWFVTLCLPGIVVYGRVYYGWMILLMGWSAINLAWFSNIFFLFAASRIFLSASRVPIVASLIAALMSLDTFRLVGQQHGESWGNIGGVFGYGVGAVLWFAAIALLWIATAQRGVELARAQGKSAPVYLKLFRATGYFLLLLTILGSVGLAAWDRKDARQSEKRLLEVAVFKRGAVCRAPDQLPLNPPVKLTGPLEIVGNGEARAQSFWHAPQDLLKWGASTVRVGNVDYVIADRNKIVAQKAQGPAAARLSVTIIPNRSIDVELSQNDTASSKHFHWSLNADSGIACPEIDPIEQPRKLLLDSLSLHEPPPAPVKW